MKKYIVVSLALGFLPACGSSDKSHNGGTENENSIDLTQTDLSGTWILSVETDTMKISTNEYLKTNFYQDYYFLDDTDDGVKTEYCADLGGWASYGVKTKEHFYTSIHSEGFSTLNNGSLYKARTYYDDYYTDLFYNEHITLEKISNDQLLDFGSLYLTSSNINIAEEQHVCATRYWSNLGTTQTINIFVPFYDGNIYFKMEFYGTLEIGQYDFEDYNSNNQITDLELYSRTSEFALLSGSDDFIVESGSVYITEISSNSISANFNFLDHTDELYTGSFSVTWP